MANVNNYIAAANAAVKKAVMARKALAENKPRYDEQGKANIKAKAEEKIVAMKANQAVANATLDAATRVEGANIKVDRDKSIASSRRTARKAGLIAGGAAMLGVGHMMMKRKHEPDAMLSSYASMRDKLTGQIADADKDFNSAQTKLDSLNTAVDTTKSSDTPESPKVTPTNTQSNGTSVLGGSESIFQKAADITGKFESDSSGGYNAYNLGGSDGGNTAHGSGNSADGKQFGSALTAMTIGKIKGLQASGKLHAAGRFQFIGNSLPEAAQFAGLDDNSLFTPENQNKMFMAFGKKYGSGRWVGLNKATPEERSIIDQAFKAWNP